MGTAVLIVLRGPLINGKSLDVRIKKTKIKIKIIAALTPAPDETGFGSMSSAYSGFSVLKNFAYKTTTPIMIIDGTITANSGPTVEDIIYSGTKRANPDKSVTPKTPFNALTEPPTTMTTKKGHKISSIPSCNVIFVAKPTGFKSVKLAKVVVGIPMEPKVVGTVLAIRQARMDRNGLYPKPTIMLAGIATAVPKPAIPSMKAPNPHAINRARIRLSLLTVVSICLITSILFV